MPKDNGKVILSLLAGATAGIVTGLLLAPETGEDLRKSLREAAGKWGGSFGKLAQDALGKLQHDQPGHTNPDAAVSEDRNAADALFNSMSAENTEPGDLATSATGNGRSIGGDAHPAEHNSLDYDGDGSDGRHRGLGTV
ncbi:MAG TPA: YtxH domain-containing protein [Hymenobacter sp.]|uniref:YtxH domain-containing protein n=1 Tax=Hymenobacter sp. TaxID=1898978 RepID=UPI002D7E4A4C|nr:YtxH domain-containing protein [Hymenobacter sp.]HET9506070.1 YtxH domain-containing protein [Hymenobacter sp.]